MEIIDKEELLDKHGAYWVSKFDKKKSIDCKDAISAIEEVESYYLKQIEEKDIEIAKYKEAYEAAIKYTLNNLI